MKKEEILKNLFDAVVELDVQKGKDAATLLIKENHDPVEGIENGLSKGMKACRGYRERFVKGDESYRREI